MSTLSPFTARAPPAWIATVNETAEGFAITSVILSIITILTFLLFPTKRRFPVRLPMYICIACLGLSIFCLMSSDSLCRVQAIGIYYFGTASWVWWAIVSFNFYDIVIRGKMGSVQKRERLYTAIGWVVPAAFLCAAILSDALEQDRRAGIWECFLKRENSATTYMLFYGWLGAVCVAALFIWPRCLYAVYTIQMYQSGSKSKSVKVLAYSRHLYFMVIFFVYFIILLALHIRQSVDANTYALSMLHSIAVTSIGLWLFLIFGLSKQNILLWKAMITTCDTSTRESDGMLQDDSAYTEMDDNHREGGEMGGMGGMYRQRNDDDDDGGGDMGMENSGSSAYRLQYQPQHQQHASSAAGPWKSVHPQPQFSNYAASTVHNFGNTHGTIPHSTSSSNNIALGVPGAGVVVGAGVGGNVPVHNMNNLASAPPSLSSSSLVASASMTMAAGNYSTSQSHLASLRPSYIDQEQDDGGLYSSIGESPRGYDPRYAGMWRPQ